MAEGQNLTQYANKKVTVIHTVEGETDAQELEGTVEAANEQALLVKPKGKTGMQLIEAGNIVEVRYVDEKPKAIVAKVLKPIEFGKARAHLLERHGATLAEINGLSEKAAFEKHEALDHKAADLGHVHGEPEKKAEAAPEGDV